VYVPGHFAADDAAVRELLERHGAADLVTVTAEGLVATMLPFIYVPGTNTGEASGPGGGGSGAGGTGGGSGTGGDGNQGGGNQGGRYGSLHGHLARNNPQWKLAARGAAAASSEGGPMESHPFPTALAIVRGPDAYISPSFYAESKPAHGRVVPTWNYVTAHVYGALVVHDDAAWTESVVRRLTSKHEAGSSRPWSVDDAPRSFIEGQLRAIVGVELVISRIEAKAKLSQNRPPADVTGVIAGLRDRGDSASADAVQRANADRR
jgi:transcriptional regulator